jgi:hypothetical protein
MIVLCSGMLHYWEEARRERTIIEMMMMNLFWVKGFCP